MWQNLPKRLERSLGGWAVLPQHPGLWEGLKGSSSSEVDTTTFESQLNWEHKFH